MAATGTGRAALALAALLLGCAAGGIELSAAGAAPPGESIVFGSVEVEGELLAKTPLIASGSESISIWSLDRDEEIAVAEIEPFYWHLPPGRYAIMHYREDRTVSLIVASQHKSYEAKLGAAFTVPPEPSVLYIGTLRVQVLEDEKISKSIVDDHDAAVAAFRAEYPGATGEPRRQLMLFTEE